MSKCLFHWRTALGPRTVIVEISDPETAQAVINAHLALGENASRCSEMPRLSLSDHIAQHKRKQKRARSKAVPAPNVLPLRKQRT